MKKKPLLIQLLSTVFLLSFFAACSNTTPVKIENQQCEYLNSPLGIDTHNPRFSWNFSGYAQNFSQQAYQVTVATSASLLTPDKADMWVSDKITSDVAYTRYSGKQLSPHTKYYWQITAWDNNGNVMTSNISTFETAKFSLTDWQATWITDQHNKEFEPAPMFRKSFKVNKKIDAARVYVSATGYYELFINGSRVGENFLDPGYTHYDKRSLYVTHDITPMLTNGENVIAAVLGNGFYNCQSKAVWDFETARWRNRPSMLCEVRVTYTDGSTELIPTDATWKTNTGPYTYNNIYSGDRYDATLEEDGWNNTGFDDKAWNEAKLTTAPSPLLVAQQARPIQVSKELVPISVKAFENNTVYVFDMGENISGVCRFNVKGDRGTHFKLQHGELLKEDGRLQPGNIDVYYHPQKPGELFQTDEFTLKGSGKIESFTPQFSYHGFRYVEVTADRPVTLSIENIRGLFFYSAVPETGKFECSNPLLNKILDATNRSYKGNLHSIPTDCPQREKNGWTADAHIAIDLALLNFDGITIYEKWMNDFIDNQQQGGDISGIIPSSGWGYADWIGPVWDAALFIIPDALYNYYGDKTCIENLYPTMLKYLDYLKTREIEDGTLHYGLGDWVFYRAQTPNDYTSTAFYYLDYTLMARFATLLGKDATPYTRKAKELKNLINKKHFNPETGIYANGTQTAQALPLYLKIVPEGKEQLVADNLNKIIVDNNYFLDFGLLGSKTVLRMLAQYGYIETAYNMATKTEAPSWGYWIETMGYTTLAETWTLSPEFRDASLNHVFMGDISAWLYNVLAGINYDATQPGFKNIIIKPCFPAGLDFVIGEYKSIKGLIKSEWKRNGNGIELTVSIPSGSTATIYADKEYKVGSGVYKYQINN